MGSLMDRLLSGFPLDVHCRCFCLGVGGGGRGRAVESLTWTDFCQGFHWMYTAGASAWGWGGGEEGRGRATESLTWTDFCQGILWVFTAGASFPDLLDERCPCTPLPFISSRDQQGGGGVIFHEQSSVGVCAGCTLPVLLLGGGEWGGS